MTEGLFISADSLAEIDRIEGEAYSALGPEPIVMLDLSDPMAESAARRLKQRAEAVVVGLHASGRRCKIDAEPFDALLTVDKDVEAPWVHVPANQMPGHVDDLIRAVNRSPAAASVLCRVLRMNEGRTIGDAVALESLAYSTLLGGGEFARWIQRRKKPFAGGTNRSPVNVERSADCMTITLADPSSRNAMRASMRDALFNALVAALEDPDQPTVLLRGEGRCFSTGGALDEFGTAKDLAQAHLIRTARSCAVLLHELGERAHVLLHGACVGSGLEVPAAAANRVATGDAWFQLPELKMGLIPGAGGTVSVARAIGRHRCCHMVLSGRRIDARTALQWGLVQALDPD